MILLRIMAIAIIMLLVAPVHAQLSFCNKTLKSVDVAVNFMDENNNWRTKGWYNFAPGECANVISGNLRNRYYYYYAKRDDGIQWGGSGSSDDRELCVRSVAFDLEGCTFSTFPPSDVKQVWMKRIDTGEKSTSHRVNLTKANETIPEVKVGEIQKKCIARWDDSHQIHSSETIIEWNYQAVKTKMKKLEHCVELTVTGPIEIEGIARSYVDKCIDYGLNHQKTRHILGLIAAIVADVYGTGGAATSAKLADYVSSASNETIDCLTDADRITAHIGEKLRAKFDASVRHESHWVYWDL